MIKLRSLISEIISEEMSYADLMNSSDPNRKDRSKRIPSKSLMVRSINDREAWKFSYKTPSDENTTGLRHQGFIHFLKEQINPGDNAMNIPCRVDCSCPDYKFRFSYANKQQNAGENGPNSLNKGQNYPSSINRGPGLCKHLLSLKEYLKTQIDSEPQSSQQHQTTQPSQGTTVAIPSDPKPETIPADNSDEDDPKIQQDPTQTPEPEKTPTLSTQPIGDPSQTPQEPEKEEPKTSEENPEEFPDKEKEPLKEWEERIELFKALDEFCKKNPIFII
jgi:hypothetical protein